MSVYKFNTTLKCAGCVSTITPTFDQEKGIEKWSVDLSHNPKILTVETESLTPEEIENLLEKNGYKGTLIS